MPSEPEEACLGDYVALHRGNTYKSALLGQPGPVLLGLASIRRNGGFRSDSLKTYGGESAEKIILRPGDIYVSLKDVTQSADLLGAVSRVPSGIPLGRLTQDTVKLEFKSNEVPSSYIYWLLRTPIYREYCSARRMGTTNLSLSRKDFLAFPVPALTEDALNLIHLLEAIESKITLLRESNANLEAIAQALFNSWFVDFEPVRAKAEGRDFEGVPPEVVDLFPSEFEESELGAIPRGWKVRRWGDIASLEYGKALRGYRESVGSIPVYGTNGFIGFHDEAHCSHPGIVIGRKGAYRGVHFSPVPFCAIDTAFFMESREELSWRWAFYELLRFNLNAMDSGSAIPSTDRNLFHRIPVCVPPLCVQKAFENLLSACWEKQQSNIRESNSLGEIRDTLLPRLMSGKLRVPQSQSDRSENV